MADVKSPAAIIAKLRRDLEKKYKDSQELFLDFGKTRAIESVPTGSVIIDAVTGLGGWPRGRVSELWGGFSTGKTTLLCHSIAALQRSNPDAISIFADFEHAFDPIYARRLGVDLNPEKLIFLQPDFFEQGDEAIDRFITEGIVDLVCIDSAAAMTPKDDLEGKVDSTGRIGLQAQLMSRFLARATKKISRGRKPALVIANQTRSKIDTKNPRNNREDSAAGSALKFYTSMRVGLELVHSEGDENRGGKGTDQLYTQAKIRATAFKNKLASPFRRGLILIKFGQGVDNIGSIAELAEAKLGIMGSTGHFSYDGDSPETTVKGRGRDTLVDLLSSNRELRREITKRVLSSIEQEQAELLGLERIEHGAPAKEIENSPVLLDSGIPLEEA